MVKLVTRKQPIVMLWREDLLNADDWLIINMVYKMQEYTVLYDYREHIYINPAIKDSKKLVETVKKIFADQCIYRRTEKLFDEVEAMTDHQTMLVLSEVWYEWREKVNALRLNEQAKGILKQIRSQRLYYKARKESAVIKELFDIGFGIYEDKAKCDWKQGAENAFMYGYLMGMNAERKAV